MLCSDKDDPELNLVGERGLSTMIEKCKQKELYELQEKLTRGKNSGLKIFVHNSCRKKLTRIKKASVEVLPSTSKRLRSFEFNDFDWKTCCCLCAKPADFARNPSREQVRVVETLEFKGFFL